MSLFFLVVTWPNAFGGEGGAVCDRDSEWISQDTILYSCFDRSRIFRHRVPAHDAKTGTVLTQPIHAFEGWHLNFDTR